MMWSYLIWHQTRLTTSKLHAAEYSSECKSSRVSHEISHIWNPKVYYHVYKSQSLFPILSLINLVNALQSNFFKIHFNTILPPAPSSSKWSLSLRFINHNPLSISLFPHTNHILSLSHRSWLITVTIFGEAYKSFSSSLSNFFFSSPYFTVFTSAHTSPSTPHCQTPPAYILTKMWQTKFHTHIKQRAKL